MYNRYMSVLVLMCVVGVNIQADLARSASQGSAKTGGTVITSEQQLHLIRKSHIKNLYGYWVWYDAQNDEWKAGPVTKEQRKAIVRKAHTEGVLSADRGAGHGMGTHHSASSGDIVTYAVVSSEPQLKAIVDQIDEEFVKDPVGLFLLNNDIFTTEEKKGLCRRMPGHSACRNTGESRGWWSWLLRR